MNEMKGKKPGRDCLHKGEESISEEITRARWTGKACHTE